MLDRPALRAAVKAFEAAYGAKFAKAVSNVVPMRHRTRVTKGPGSRAAGPAMTFKLIESAQARPHPVSAPRLVALVRAGARFERRVFVERDEVTAA